MPTLDELQERLGGDKFQVVALSMDRAGAQAVRDFYSEIGIDHLRLYIDSNMRAMSRLRIQGLPTTLILDRQGREIARLIGEADGSAPKQT
jgi:thiol-disulfide isomerase/thioredoxin